LFRFEKDLCIDDIQLWLDSKRKRELGFVSHAHADHIANHKKILCTPATGRFLKKRLKKPNYTAIPYKEPFEIKDSTVQLFPAGHMLGSAQIKISNASGTLLYTGDFKIDASRTAEKFEFTEADIVIMETTFGSPSYELPPRKDIEDELITTCRELLKQNRVPIVFAYSLGKGQEALKILSDAGLRVAADYNILKYVPVYQEFGISFKVCEKFKRSEFRDKVLLLPPSFRYHRFIQSLPGRYSIFLSGWAMHAKAEQRFSMDRVLPLSDHADFRQLLEFVHKVKPEVVYCTHGMQSFISILKSEGFNAFPLNPK
jgi:Cft2 family RNA processing exonuclease